MLFGVYGAGGRPDGSSLLIAAGVWNTICMIISALFGGYVAVHSSGLRRHAGGVMRQRFGLSEEQGGLALTGRPANHWARSLAGIGWA